MKKILRLTENDLTRIVKRVIREQDGESHNKISDEDFDSFLDVLSQYESGDITWDDFLEKSEAIGSKYVVGPKPKSNVFIGLSNQVEEFNQKLSNHYDDLIRNSTLFGNIYDAYESGELTNDEGFTLLKMIRTVEYNDR
jgi:hypothetical protein